ncbi:hypothetical protein GPALN_007942 [Globodera pallida]|nr:hypothetical protein GPALN_007942 [Globodera pallida]
MVTGVTVVPHGDDLGHTSLAPRVDQNDRDRLCLLLAGGVAAILGTGTAPGCEQDNRQAEELAERIVVSRDRRPMSSEQLAAAVAVVLREEEELEGLDLDSAGSGKSQQLELDITEAMIDDFCKIVYRAMIVTAKGRLYATDIALKTFSDLGIDPYKKAVDLGFTSFVAFLHSDYMKKYMEIDSSDGIFNYRAIVTPELLKTIGHIKREQRTAFPELNKRSINYAQFRIVYSRDFLLRCAWSPYATLPPKDIREIVMRMGDIVAHFPRRRPFIKYC